MLSRQAFHLEVVQQGVEHPKGNILKGKRRRIELNSKPPPAEKYDVRKIFPCRTWPTCRSGDCSYYQRDYAPALIYPAHTAQNCLHSQRAHHISARLRLFLQPATMETQAGTHS